MQLSHDQSRFIPHNFSIILICDAIRSPANIGSLFRLADAFGIQKIVFGGVQVDLGSSRLKRTARATQNWVNVENDVNLNKYLPQLIQENYHILALEITDESIALDTFVLQNLNKIALVIGEENTGISPQILAFCQQQVHINMYGKNSSMNVAQATAIALYEISKQLK